MSASRVISAVLVYALGLFLMIGADSQKFFTLQIKKGLLSTGFFSETRNPNYLGEIMIYLSFAILAEHVLVYGYLILVWLVVFHFNMINKEISLRSKAGYMEYAQKSYYLMPKLFSSNFANMVVYCGAGVILYCVYCA